MRCASAIADDQDLESAARTAAATARDRLGGIAADLVVAFASPRYGDLERLPIWLGEHLGARTLVGCTGGGLIGGGRELEDRRGVAVFAASLPGASVHAVELGVGDLPDADGPPSDWHRLFPCPPGDVRGFLVLPEPFHFDAAALLAGLDFAWPDAVKVGGIASGSRHPQGHALFLGRRTLRTGAVVAALCGDVALEALVAQGCKPIGRAGRITRCEGNALLAVDGISATDFLQQQLEGLDADDRALVGQVPLFLGLAMDRFAQGDPGDGEFLIRNLVGLDAPRGRILVGEQLAVGLTVRFHLRERMASALDLQQVLARGRLDGTAGALLFSCLGRGSGLYGRPGHDSDLFFAAAGDVPLGGFFCNGEIGPVGRTTHLHGYTSAFALLRPRREARA